MQNGSLKTKTAVSLIGLDPSRIVFLCCAHKKHNVAFMYEKSTVMPKTRPYGLHFARC